MYLIQDCNTLEFAYHGEGWAFTSVIGDAKRFASLGEAEKARDEILSHGEFLLQIIPVRP
jgi:hypothetical protein